MVIVAKIIESTTRSGGTITARKSDVRLESSSSCVDDVNEVRFIRTSRVNVCLLFRIGSLIASVISS